MTGLRGQNSLYGMSMIGHMHRWTLVPRHLRLSRYGSSHAAHCPGMNSTISAQVQTSASNNIFDNLPALQAPQASDQHDELERYLSTNPEHVGDVLVWWHEHKHIYPRLYRMALDYLSIPGMFSSCSSPFCLLIMCFPATSVDVERTFSQGRLVLSHVRSRLSVQSTRALLCLGVWSLMGYVKDSDIEAAAILPEVDGEEEALANDWDDILY